MKNIITIIALLVTTGLYGQDNVLSSDTLQISGKLKVPVTYTLASLDTFKKVSLGDVEFLDGKEKKYSAQNIKGIPLKNLFANSEFIAENHKSLNSFYFVFSAVDDFKVVFSYNEIFHPQGTNNFYIVTDYGGKNIREIKDGILVISANYGSPGHKYTKALTSISIEEAK